MIKKCPFVLVDGGFSNWTDWSICSRPCGEGTSFSRRYCNNPVPALKGKECSGIDIMTKPCYMPNCMCMLFFVLSKEVCFERNVFILVCNKRVFCFFFS